MYFEGIKRGTQKYDITDLVKTLEKENYIAFSNDILNI